MSERIKFNLVDSTFSHLDGGRLPIPNKGYSVHGKESTCIEWVTDGSGVGKFYTDKRIPEAFSDDSGELKYAWFLESKAIVPELYQHLTDNMDAYLEKFDSIFVFDKSFLSVSPKFKWVPAQGYWIQKAQMYDKTKMISMIASNKLMCPGHQVRLDYIEKFDGQVDHFGNGYTWIDWKEEGLCYYMFSIAMENCEVPGYFTEKVLDCFATGTIPIYLGDPDIGDHFNMDGVIWLSDEFDVSEEIYESKLDAVKDNLERVQKMEVLEDYIWEHHFKEKFGK